MLRLKCVSLWSIVTEQNFPNLQYSGVTLEKRLNPKFLFTPNTLWRCWGVPNKEQASPCTACTPLLAAWLAVLQYLRPCGHLPALSLPGGCLPVPSICLLWLSTAHILPRQNSALKLPAGLSHSPHAECLQKLQKEKNKPPIELPAIGDLNGLDINPTRTSGSNRLPWMLDSIQLKSFHEIN